ncbi:hypothetical protein BHE74_00029181 [Ensete ventricosum]|nr:hypothetical protein BHE74_00029181 [Ensete ventricosum]
MRLQIRVSALPALGRPYDRLRPASFLRQVGHVDGPVVRGRTYVAAGSPSAISLVMAKFPASAKCGHPKC